MASLRAKMVNFWLRRMMKSKPLHLMDPEVVRARTDGNALVKKAPKGFSLEVVDGEVKGEWHRPDTGGEGRLIYYLHGGGYVFGSPLSHRSLTFALAGEVPADVFSLDYRLAPEHPFPAAAEDAVAGYRWLLSHGWDPQSIIVSGDSAGGGLSMAMLLACKNEGLPLPSGAVLFSPWTDLSVSGASIDSNEPTDAMFQSIHIREGVHKYLNGADPKNPLASPLFGDLNGLPPVLTFVSETEVLRDDSTRLHQRLVEAGVEAQLVTEHGVAHVWPVFTPLFPEAKDSVKEAAAFVRALTEERLAA